MSCIELAISPIPLKYGVGRYLYSIRNEKAISQQIKRSISRY